MEYEIISKTIKIILNYVLTPVIYMFEHENWIEFVCFCDRKITIGDLYEAEQEVKKIIGKDAEIIDIREFAECERIDVIGKYSLIYSADDFVGKVFEAATAADFQLFISEKQSILERHNMCGTYYLQ